MLLPKSIIYQPGSGIQYPVISNQLPVIRT